MNISVQRRLAWYISFSFLFSWTCQTRSCYIWGFNGWILCWISSAQQIQSFYIYGSYRIFGTWWWVSCNGFVYWNVLPSTYFIRNFRCWVIISYHPGLSHAWNASYCLFPNEFMPIISSACDAYYALRLPQLRWTCNGYFNIHNKWICHHIKFKFTYCCNLHGLLVKRMWEGRKHIY